MLDRLGTDYVDLLYLHQPVGDYMAGWRGLESAVKAGKVRAIGLSNFDLNEALFDDVIAKSEIKPAIVQIELHPYAQRKAFRKKCAENGIAVEGWYPLGGTHGGNSVLFADPVINEIAGRYGKTPAEIILRWHVQEGFSTIPGSRNEAHIRQNITVLDFELTEDDMNRIRTLDGERRFYTGTFESSQRFLDLKTEATINSANVYQLGSSETITGRLIREFGLSRDEIVVATKVNFEMRAGKPNGSGSSRKNIMAEIDHSLQRLGLDYVDLYQIHRLDAITPMEEIMEALHDVVKSGKARYIGACTMDAWQFERLQNIAERHNWTKFITMQNQYNLIYREEEHEMMPLCLDRKVGVNPWSPLAGGRCAHPWGTQTKRTKIDAVSPMVWTEKTAAQDKAVVDNLERIARENGRTMAQESLAWMLSKPFICSPVVGTTSVKHVEEAASAVDITLAPDEIAALEAPYVAHTKQHAF